MALEVHPFAMGESVGGIVDGCDVDDCGTVDGCMIGGRAVDGLCSTMGIDGASAGSGVIAADVSACNDADRV